MNKIKEILITLAVVFGLLATPALVSAETDAEPTKEESGQLHSNEPALDEGNPTYWHRFQVARLYYAYFNRAPDEGGWGYWNYVYSDKVADGGALMQISSSFAESQEFKNTYGDATNAEFVELVYTNVMGRNYDVDGYNYWLSVLNDGQINRGELMVYFSESAEYVRKMGPTMTGEHWDDTNFAAECDEMGEGLEKAECYDELYEKQGDALSESYRKAAADTPPARMPAK